MSSSSTHHACCEISFVPSDWVSSCNFTAQIHSQMKQLTPFVYPSNFLNPPPLLFANSYNKLLYAFKISSHYLPDCKRNGKHSCCSSFIIHHWISARLLWKFPSMQGMRSNYTRRHTSIRPPTNAVSLATFQPFTRTMRSKTVSSIDTRPLIFSTECIFFAVVSMENNGSVVSHLISQVKIGMDLTKVALPTFILERRSLLEMYADYFAHPDVFVG